MVNHLSIQSFVFKSPLLRERVFDVSILHLQSKLEVVGLGSSYLMLWLRCSRLQKLCIVRVKLLIGLFHNNKTSTIGWLSSPVSWDCSLSSGWPRSHTAVARTRHSVLSMDLWFKNENSPLYTNKLFVSQQYVRDGSVDCIALTEGNSDVLVVAPNFRISEPASIN